MHTLDFAIYTAEVRPDLHDAAQDIVSGAFPEFMNHSPVINAHFRALPRLFPKYQFVLWQEDTKTIGALANAMPLRWDGSLDKLPDEGVEWALEKAVEDHQAGVEPNVLCAFQIIIAPHCQGQGLSYEAVKQMANVARQHDLKALIAPVRPNRKENYPEMAMAEYLKRRRPDGLWADDWLRVHEKVDGTFAGICSRSFIAVGTVTEWESWTDMEFRHSGDYVIPEGLAPVKIDIESNRGLYVEPNVWMVHRVSDELT